MENGLIQVYTGDGKGKTTAAVGLAVRALGQGMRVLLVRFLKPDEPRSGEIVFLDASPDLEILSSGVGVFGDKADRKTIEQSVRKTFARARKKMAVERFDLTIFDEINNVVHRGYLPVAEVLSLLDEVPPGMELVLTGRNAPEPFLERAHLVTRMEKVKHPLDQGIAARKGIEY
jgi:cob(I)alamin adenosyltransferase